MAETLVPVRVSATCHGLTRSDIAARHHTLVIDEPESRHGNDAGMLPLEALMASLAGCTHVIANKIAGEMGFELHDVRIDVCGMLDHRGIAGQEALDVPFPRVRFDVALKTSATPNLMFRLQEALRWRCPVLALLRAAGSEVSETWDIEYL